MLHLYLLDGSLNVYKFGCSHHLQVNSIQFRYFFFSFSFQQKLYNAKHVKHVVNNGPETQRTFEGQATAEADANLQDDLN